MKQITRNLITFNAEVHVTPEQVQAKLTDFAPIGEYAAYTCGFVPPHPDTENRVVAFPGGWAVALREDSRSVPASAVNKLVAEKAALIFEQTGRKVGKKERKELAEDARYELLPRAFVKSRVTVALYSTRTNHLYVNASSPKAADRMITELVLALESLKTTTINVSEPKQGLTARLINLLKGDDDAFGSLHAQGEVVLSGVNGKWSVKPNTIGNATNSLKEALDAGAKVDSIAFMDEVGVEFRVTKELRVKGVKHRVVDAAGDTDLATAWVSQAADETAALDAIFDELVAILSPEKVQGAWSDEADGLF